MENHSCKSALKVMLTALALMMVMMIMIMMINFYLSISSITTKFMNLLQNLFIHNKFIYVSNKNHMTKDAIITIQIALCACFSARKKTTRTIDYIAQ